MKDRNSAAIKFIKRMKSDYAFRTMIYAALSFLATAIFTIYNLYLGIFYRAEWNYCIAAYYAALVCFRAIVILYERKLNFSTESDALKHIKKCRAFLAESILLFIVDLSLITPVSLMVMQKKAVKYSSIPAIIIAAYTTYKISISAKNYLKARKQSNLCVKILKDISLIDAAASILSLQYTLIMTFGDGVRGDMLTMCATTSFIIWSLLIAFSIATVIFAIKERNKIQP